MIVALFVLHAWLPCGRRSFLQILPGIVFTMVASLISGIVFGQYLARFASNYVTMYAGLASVIIALVFLYFIAAIFVYGGELNAAIMKSRLPKGDVASCSAVARARGDTGLTRKMSAPAARDAASSSLRPDMPMIGMRPSGGCKRANARDRLDAVDPRQHHVHQHRIECAVREPLRRGLALADELGLVTEFGQDRVEHDAAERIVLDAEQAQRPRRSDRCLAIGAGRRRHRVLCRRHHDIEGKGGAAATALRHGDVAAHGARQLLDRRQSEPGAAEARGDGDIGLRERPEQALDFARA